MSLNIPAGGSALFTLTFNPQASGTATANVSFSTSGSSSPITEAVTGSGTPPAALPHSVDLSWSPSTSTVAGYNIYRGSVTGGPYTKLDPAPDTVTSYIDSSVTAGQTYFYVTTAVASDGTESTFSNQVSAAIPTP
jgi:fibronectin type 3 domain-containing protein